MKTVRASPSEESDKVSEEDFFHCIFLASPVVANRHHEPDTRALHVTDGPW